jgi:hypothetical protein
MRSGAKTFAAFMAALIPPEAHRYSPTRPGLIRVQERVGFIGKPGKRRRPSSALVEQLVDRSRYPGHVLREIRAGRVVNGHANWRECLRRQSRGCVQ